MFRVPYLRNYPWFLQLFIFIMLLFLIAFVAVSMLTVLLPIVTGYSLTQATAINENSNYSLIKAAELAQGISHAGIFLIPSLLFAYLTHPQPLKYLGIRKPGNNIHWLLVVFITIGAMPVLLELVAVFQSVHLGKWADDAQKQIDSAEKAFFIMPSFSSFLSIFFIMAVLPALGEEMLFRGIILRFTQKRIRGIAIPILITALMFALVHFSVYGLVPIFLSGVLLGLIYYLTGSLLCSMLFHLLNNGLQVLIVYIGKSSTTVNSAVNDNNIPIPFVLGGALILAISLYLLWKYRTPLPPDWATDFSKEELNEKAKEDFGI